MSLPSGRYGYSLLAADLNRDGFGDLVVGAPDSGKEAGSMQILQGDCESGEDGEVRLWLGGDRGPSPNPLRLTPTILGIPADVAQAGEFGAAVEAGRLDRDDYADIVVGMPGAIGQEGRIAIVPGGRDGYAAGGHKILRAELSGDATRFASTLALRRLAGEDEQPDVVVAAEGAEPFEAVHVVRDGTARRVEGLERVVQGHTTELRLGRTPSP